MSHYVCHSCGRTYESCICHIAYTPPAQSAAAKAEPAAATTEDKAIYQSIANNYFKGAEPAEDAARLATGEPVAWMFKCKGNGKYMEYATVDENDTNHWPLDQWRSVEKVPLYSAAIRGGEHG